MDRLVRAVRVRQFLYLAIRVFLIIEPVLPQQE